MIRNNTVLRNGGSGIEFTTLGGLLIQGNVVIENEGTGIFVNGRAIARGNSSTANGGDGLEGFTNCRLTENAANQHTGVGLRLAAGCSYERNQITGNAGGSVVGGVQTGTNFCDPDAICP